MRAHFQNTDARIGLAPALRTSSATGGTIDRLGFEAVSFLVVTGAWTDGSHAVSAEASDDGASWAAIPAGDLVGAFPTVAAAGAASKTTRVSYTGDARYVRVKSAASGSPSTGAIVGVVVLLDRPHSAPVAA